MSKVDRSKWVGASVKAIEKQAETIKSVGGEKTNYLKIDSGTNKIRLMPAHPGTIEDNFYALQRVVSWVPFVKKDGSESRRPIMNARVHGGNGMKDIIEAYIAYASKAITADSSIKPPQKAIMLDAISDYKDGIKPKGSFLAYAKKITKDGDERGLLEVSYGIKKQLDNISLAELESEPDAGDPLSDPYDGYAVNIKYDKSLPSNQRYSCVLTLKPLELTDEDFEWLEEQKPLAELLNGVYNKRDFKNSVEGLEIFDRVHKIDVFNDDEFQDIIAEIEPTIPDAPAYGNDAEDDSEEEVVQLEDMTRAQLKQFVLDEGLDITITRKHTEDQILDMIEDLLGELPVQGSSKAEKKADKVKDEPFSDGVDGDESEEEEEAPPARVGRGERRGRRVEAEVEEEEEEAEEEAEEEVTTSRRSGRRRGR